MSWDALGSKRHIIRALHEVKWTLRVKSGFKTQRAED